MMFILFGSFYGASSFSSSLLEVAFEPYKIVGQTGKHIRNTCVFACLNLIFQARPNFRERPNFRNHESWSNPMLSFGLPSRGCPGRLANR